MLVPMDALAPSYAKYKEKLETLMRLRTEAPQQFRASTDHFASMS